MTTLTELKQIIGQTLLDNTSIPQYVIAKENAPRPLGSYASIDIAQLEHVSWGYKKTVNSDVNDLDVETTNLYLANIDIEMFRGDARDQEVVFSHSLVTERVKAEWAVLNIGLIARAAAIDISKLQDASYEERSIMQITVMFQHTLALELVTNIDIACITGDIDNGVEVVDQIQVGNTKTRPLQLIQPSDVQDFDYAGSDAVLSNGSTILVTGSPTADSGSAAPIFEGVLFDGVNDYLSRNTDFIGNQDTKVGTVSFVFDLQGVVDEQYQITDDDNGTLDINLSLDEGDIYFTIRVNDPDVIAMDFTSSVLAPGKHTVIASWDLSIPIATVYIDDISHTIDEINIPFSDLGYSAAQHTVGAIIGGNTKYNGCLSEYWFSSQDYLDLTVIANRRLFFDATNNPVDKGIDGSTPTGNQPIIYLSGDATNFQDNLGYGGGYAVNGSLEDCIALNLTSSDEDTGAAYVYQNINGVFTNEQKLVAPDAISLDRFGHAVYVGGLGTTIVIAAQQQSTDVQFGGAVYVFKPVSGIWTFTQRMVTTNGISPFDRFGFSLSFSDDESTIAVGAPQEDGAGINAGAVYVFEWDGAAYQQAARITLATPLDQDRLGQAVHLSRDGQVLFAGAVKADLSGQVAVKFKGTGWTDGNEDALIIASDTAPNDSFGVAVNSIDVFGGTPLTSNEDGSVLIIGAIGWEGAPINQGAAYHFIRSGNIYVEQPYNILASDIQAFSYFGYTVSLNASGSLLLATSQAQNDDPPLFGVGLGFLYKLNNGQYVLHEEIEPIVHSQNSFYGYRAFIDDKGGLAVITASDYNGTGQDQGANFIYNMPICF